MYNVSEFEKMLSPNYSKFAVERKLNEEISPPKSTKIEFF